MNQLKRAYTERSEERKKRAKDLADSRRAKYANFRTMKELQDYVQNNVETRTALPKSKRMGYMDDETHEIERTTGRLGKTTMLEPDWFDKQLLERACELYLQANPEVTQEQAAKEKELQTAEEQICIQLDEHIRLLEQVEESKKKLEVLCGSDVERAVDARKKGADDFSFIQGPIQKLIRSASLAKSDAKKYAFLEMVATAQKGRAKTDYDFLRWKL
jgi:hypothetical protein